MFWLRAEFIAGIPGITFDKSADGSGKLVIVDGVTGEIAPGTAPNGFITPDCGAGFQLL
jgi:hypothetical protein